MKKEQYVLVIIKITNASGEENNSCNTVHTETCQDKGEVRRAINKYLENETKGTKLPLAPAFDGQTRTIEEIFLRNEGNFAMGNETVQYQFILQYSPGEYFANEDEVFNALDGFLNSTRGNKEYTKLAELITTQMHRYTQASLWRFIKVLIKTIAKTGYDARNEGAVREANIVINNNQDEIVW